MSSAFTLFLVCIIFACGSTLHDGSVAQSLIATLAVVALACVGFSASATDVMLARRSSRVLWLAALPAIWMMLQLLPTPIGAHSIWSYANEALGRHSWGHVSIDLGTTLLALTFYLANIALIIVATFVGRARRSATLTLFVLTSIVPILIIVLLLSRAQLIPSFDAGDFSDILPALGTFALLLSMASAMHILEERESKREEREDWASSERFALMGSGIAFVIGVFGIAFGSSFNGYLTAAFGVVTFGSILLIRRIALPGWAALMLIATLVIAAGMVIVWRYDPTRALSPLLQFTVNSPTDILALTQRLLADTGVQGTGAGTYNALLPIYQDLGTAVTKAPTTMSVLAIELGWPMFFFLMAATAWLIVILYRGALLRGRDSVYPAVAAAVAFAIITEAFCDTSLLNSCVSVVSCAIIGLGLAQSVSPRT